MLRDPADLANVARALGSEVIRTSAPEWGDRAATVRADLRDGRSIAARRFDANRAAVAAGRIAGVMAHLGAAGLPVPVPTLIKSDTTIWLVTPWIDGQTGAAWLDDVDRAQHLARRMGRLAHDLRGVDASGLGLDADHPLSEATIARASAMVTAGGADAGLARAVLDAALAWLDADADRPRAFVHGDFAPINVIVDPAGEIVALLDVEHARIAPALLDVAWWGWVVRHHHPDMWPASWATFLTAARVEPGSATDREIRSLQVIRILEAVAGAEDGAMRAKWLRRLSEVAGW
jgi:aminoglycoside phosphotransferase (APT) family kinase protein